MMRRKSPAAATAAAGDDVAVSEWEVRPGGMLVQKRVPGSDPPPPVPVTTVRIKVKYNNAHHEIYMDSQASFAELKKRMAEVTGLHHLDQKVIFKDKERESGAFLDVAGVKDGSKMTVVEDATARAKRLLEARHNAQIEKAVKGISNITAEVDRLAAKVKAMEGIVNKGQKVVETDVIQLIESLMIQLVKLDAIVVDGDTKQKKAMQVRRVQKFVETLDVIKIKNESPKSNGQLNSMPPKPKPQPRHQVKRQQQQQQQTVPSAVVTTKWETFDSLFSPTSSGGSATATPTSATAAPKPRFDWELF